MYQSLGYLNVVKAVKDGIVLLLLYLPLHHNLNPNITNEGGSKNHSSAMLDGPDKHIILNQFF